MSSKKLGWKILLSGVSLAAMGAMNPAFAQDNSDQSEEIVVTATGRTAALQDVPVAVTAVGHEQLEQSGVNNIIDLRQVTPNLRIGTGQSQSSGTAASIRGLGTGSDNPGFEAAVGIFIDGVYRARTGSAIADLPDIERVEILRGPQGTLYGKNTTAGAISVVTAQPDFTPSFWLEGSAGNLDLLGTRFGANLPISDNLAFRVDGSYRARDGFIDNVLTPGDTIDDTNRWSGRLQLLWDINEDASLRIIADQGMSDEVCCGAVTLADTSDVALFPFSFAMNLVAPGSVLTPVVGFPGTTAPADPEAREMTVSPARGYAESADDHGISAQLDWDLGGNHLTSITAYRNWDTTRDQDIDFSRMDRAYRDGLQVGVEDWTQEIRLQGEWGRVNWLIGAFYGNEHISQRDRIQYGAQAAAYVNTLSGFVDMSANTLYSTFNGSDFNGGIPGSGLALYTGAACGSVFTNTDQCILDYIFQTFAATIDPALDAALSLPAGTLATFLANGSAVGGLADDLSIASLHAGDGQQSDRWRLNTESYALFTHNEISLTDALTLTLGARYTHETKDLRADLNAQQGACDALRDTTGFNNTDTAITAASIYAPNPLLTPVQQAGLLQLQQLVGAGFLLSCNPAVNNVQDGNYADSFSDSAVTGIASLSYHLNDDMMLYASYSRGYKSGGYNIDRSGFNVTPITTLGASTLGGLLPTFGVDDLRFDPETIDAYEVGFKSTLFRMATLNLAVFYEQLHDYQLNAFTGFNFITNNVPEVVSQGAEVELALRPMEGLTMTAGVLYNDAEYDSTAIFATPGSAVIEDYNEVVPGERLSQSPLWTVTGSVLYQIPIGNDLKMSFYVDGRWNSDYRLQTLSHNPATDQEAFAIFNARVGLGGRDDRWTLELWGQNITDEYYSLGAFAVPEQSFLAATGRTEGVFAAFPNQPRTWGVTLRARY